MIKEKIKLGNILIEKGLITVEELANSLIIQKKNNYKKRLGEIFIDEGYVSEKELMDILAMQFKLEYIDLFGQNINFKNLENYSISILKNAMAIPFKEDEDYIYIATSDPLNSEALEILERAVEARYSKGVKLYLALKNDVKHIFERYDIIQTTKSLVEQVKKEISSDKSGVKIVKEQSAIMQLIEQIIKTAIVNYASDIHIEPDNFRVSVRIRVDGVLKEISVFDLDVYSALTSRIKILANLDISERRKAQDGRFSMVVDEKNYDFRMSTTPTLFGESIVLRILDQAKVLLKLDEIGLEDRNLEIFNELIKSPYGMIFITGPTGSGKTTTLYAALNEVKSLENKVLTVEDPIEYQLPLVQQIQTNDKINFTFLDALKSFLRQDPDIIMVGEVRDKGTLGAAIQASLTGHLVFSTLHTNDAPSAITRMLQMGLAPFLISDSLLAVVAQRLVRRVCPKCKREYKPSNDIIKKISKYLPKEYKFYKGEGCHHCGMSGYRGRIMICEILQVDDEISQLISNEENKYKIEKVAIENGFEPMVIDGLNKALRGLTTPEEVLRVAKVKG